MTADVQGAEMKVFLSYASEDGEAADLIAQWLDGRGVAFYDFRNPSRQGGRSADSRQEAIDASDFALVLMSASLLGSQWCRQDLELAVQHERLITGTRTEGAFLRVLQVADVPLSYDGELRGYDWLDMTSQARAEPALRELSYQLGVERRPENSDYHSFTNRAISEPEAEMAGQPDEPVAELPEVRADKGDDKHRKVMVIYGHDEEANQALFDWLRSVGLRPQEWVHLTAQLASGSPYIGMVLDRAFAGVQAVIAFFTPDEHVITRAGYAGGHDSWRLQARPNVLFEAGMALATHPQETILLVLGHPDLPSDLSGRHYVRLDGTAGPLRTLANRLRQAGCPVEEDGTDWLNPGRFPRRDTLSARPIRRRKPAS